MMLRTAVLAAVTALAAVCARAEDSPPAPDYASPSAWLCLPGRQDACSTTNLDAIAFDADGRRTPAPFKAAAEPEFDCFYVYPTVSAEKTTFSDAKAGAAEIQAVQSQAARFTARCRLYAPLYRQLTLAGLKTGLDAKTPLNWDMPYSDVRNAWRYYLARHNHGRGVVLIAHSQGSIHLQRLIAEEIDGKPEQKLLVTAFLGGDPVLPVPQGKDVGGVFKSVPLCRSAGQFGCVVVWATYAADDATLPRNFANNPGRGLVAGCVDPAAPGGGEGRFDGFVHKPPQAPADDPPWVEMKGQVTGECVADASGDVLRVKPAPGTMAPLVERLFKRLQLPNGWGLHILDIALVQGNLIEMVDAQGKAWKAARGSRP